MQRIREGEEETGNMENWRKFRKLEQVTGKNNTKERKGQKKAKNTEKYVDFLHMVSV